MAQMTIDQIIQASRQLTAEEKVLLIERLQSDEIIPSSGSTTRDQILSEFKRRKTAGAFDNLKSLRGILADPALKMSFEEIQKLTHEAATEWESELDELDDAAG